MKIAYFWILWVENKGMQFMVLGPKLVSTMGLVVHQLQQREYMHDYIFACVIEL